MFEAKLANAGLFKKIVESIKDLVTDAPFDCSKSGMSMQSLDSSHVAFVVLKLDARIFNTYRCDRTINLGLSLANMSKALKCANTDDTCMIKVGETGTDSVLFVFGDATHDKKQYVDVKMMDIDSENLGVPEQEYSVVCEMPATEFQKTCKDLATFSDSLNITASKGELVFEGKGDTGSNKVVFASSPDAQDENVVYLEVKEPVNLNFSMKYMNQFAKATALSDRIRLSLCNDVPVVVEYSIEGNGYLKFYLAPKIDEDEDMK